MNWGLIPEVFYDVIARLVPGTLFLLGALAVYFGPIPFAIGLASVLPAANLAALTLVALLAYFAAVVLKVMWDAGTPRNGATAAESNKWPDPFLGLRKQMPEEVARLLKLQAEKNICEVLIPGSALLLVGDIIMAARHPNEALEQRAILGVILIICGAACWRWRTSLEKHYDESLRALQRYVRALGSDDGTKSATPSSS